MADTHAHEHFSVPGFTRGAREVLSSRLSLLFRKRAVKPEVVWLCFSLWSVVFQVVIAISITTRPSCKLSCVGADRNGNITNVSLVFDLIIEGFLLVHI